MAEVTVDMSPEAVARRLEAMAQLHRLGLSLKAARRLGPAQGVGAQTGELRVPDCDGHRDRGVGSTESPGAVTTSDG